MDIGIFILLCGLTIILGAATHVVAVFIGWVASRVERYKCRKKIERKLKMGW